ncbi:MAG: alpha/beta hydrolase [Candidatus Saccharibacteria bacterium]|nr:alpha/beta hydrolase [Candidatus Saccharibacteria bacterium]
MPEVISKDGTKIAYDKIGKGLSVILVGGATSTSTSGAGLAKLLAYRFTVYNYDRRGRGDSTDTKPFAVEREIEDLEALIDESGDSGYIYGISSGACLAMLAAAQLGDKVKRLALYEAPYSESKTAAYEWRQYRLKLDKAIVADHRGKAVELFMKLVGVPDEMIVGMKKSQMWPGLEAVAPTLLYDAAEMGKDRSIPVEQAAKVKAKTLVMDGGASRETMPFMGTSAEKLAKVIPNATRRTIEGQGHDINSKILAPVLIEFFSK